MSGNGQPLPKRGVIDVGELVIKDMQTRIDMGIEKYGTKLQTKNGRDALQDAYEEALDLTMYLKQVILERREMTEVEEYEYLHDGGVFRNKIEIHKLSYKDGFYRFEVRIDDPTDYQRLMENIKYDLGIKVFPYPTQSDYLRKEGRVKDCPNQKILKDQFICCAREDFVEGVSYCQFVGKEEQCPKYSKMINGA